MGPHVSNDPTRLDEPCSCPLCGARTARLLFARGAWVRRCARCTHRFAEHHPTAGHVALVYDDAYFQGGGVGYPDYLAEGELLRARGAAYARIVARHAKPGSVLDVGAAAGFLLCAFADAGWRGTGVEPNARMVRHATTQLGLEVVQGTLETLPMPGPFDLVLLIQVVAHLTSPRAAFEAAARVTAPGGLWLVETWNPESWSARMTGAAWHEYSPPSALHYFTPRSLATLAAELGLREVERGRLTKWISVAHAGELLGHAWKGSWWERLLPMIHRLLPARARLPYPGDDLWWGLYRKDR